MTDERLRVGVRTTSLAPDRLRYIRQLGVEDVFVDPSGEAGPDRLTLTPELVPSVSALRDARARLEDVGLRFAGVQTVFGNCYGKIARGEAGAEDQLAAYREFVRNVGAADVPILGYQWAPEGAIRTDDTHPIRGGATATAFDEAELESGDESEDTEADYWERYEAFLEAVLPVAEDAGVQLAVHPADPPGYERLCGVPRLFRDIETYERAMALSTSDAHGIKCCFGCFSELGVDPVEVVDRLGQDIVFVHFRDVIGTVPRFTETFVDDGNFDELAAMHALADSGFDGVVIPDHVPNVEGDTGWGHRARGYTVGYLRGMIRAVEGTGSSTV